MSSSYTWTVPDSASMHEVEETLIMSAIAVEGLYGRSRTRIEGVYSVDHENRTCSVNGDNEVGHSLARIFTEYLAMEVGENTFRVKRECRCSKSNPLSGVLPEDKQVSNGQER